MKNIIKNILNAKKEKNTQNPSKAVAFGMSWLASMVRCRQ